MQESSHIQNVIGAEQVYRLSHIGSTAVEGIRAKAIVDILLELKNDCDSATVKEKLIADGWIVMQELVAPEFKISLNKGYTAGGFDERVYHLHIRYQGDWDELYYCDYLNANPGAAKEYEALKQELAMQYRFNREAYTEAKTDFIKKHTQIAREKFSGRYK